jgi:hypothetical protein
LGEACQAIEILLILLMTFLALFILRTFSILLVEVFFP